MLGFNLMSGFDPFGGGSTVLDLEDFIVSNIILPVGSLIYLLFCVSKHGWGWDNFLKEANAGKGLKISNALRIYMKYILPVIITIIFILGIKDKFF